MQLDHIKEKTDRFDIIRNISIQKQKTEMMKIYYILT